MTIELSKNVIDAIADAIIKKEVEEMAKFPVYEEFTKKVAEKALDEFLYNGKSIREWMQIIASEDAISRKAVIDTILAECSSTKLDIDYAKVLLLRRAIKSLPPVTPQPQTGHWEYVQYDYNPKLGNWHCSECRCVVIECVNKEEKGGIPLYKYCPQCGIKMQTKSNIKQGLNYADEDTLMPAT